MTEHDQELGAMSAVVQALTPLDENARKRVLQYALARFKSTSPGLVSDEVPEEMEPDGGQPANGVSAKEIARYDTLAELYHDVKPNSDAEKALVVSAWMQVSEGRDGIDGFSVNSALKNLGYPIGNITRALDVLVNQRPALMIQLRKSGVTKQARKLSKVTEAGLRRVKEMLNSTAK